MKVNDTKDSKINHKLIIGVLSIVIFVFAVYNLKSIICTRKYDFVNNQCKSGVIDKKAYLGLKVDLDKYFNEKMVEGDITDVSVYFRDLNDGPVMGINEHSTFSSASLLKLPIIITVFKIAETKPEILEYKLVNEGDDDRIDQHFSPEDTIKNNVSYSVNEIVRYALVYSDNKAIKMLNEFISMEGGYENNLQVVFRELGLILPDDLYDRDISTRAYASLFRLLYNSSYLHTEYSEEIMKILSESNFKTGLRAGVPEDVKVAHKFGERFLETGEKQLHDCGVVYYPKNPYLLCVMTRGNDFDKLARIIREVSEKFYVEVDSRKL